MKVNLLGQWLVIEPYGIGRKMSERVSQGDRPLTRF